jgi:hypothetical protein
MASGFYQSGLAAMLKGQIDLESDSIAAFLIDSNSYTADLLSDDTIGDIADVARVKESTLTGKTVVGGVFDCDAITFSSVTGSNADALALFVNADDVEECQLICYLDDAPEFPLTPDGTDITINPSATGLFELS